MAYRERPDIFEIHKSDWFMPLKEHGGYHLTTKIKQSHNTTLLSKIKMRIAANGRHSEFSKRMLEVAKKYKI